MKNALILVSVLFGMLTTPYFLCAFDSDWGKSPLNHDRIYNPLGAGAIYDPLNAGSPLGLFPNPEYTVPLGPSPRRFDPYEQAVRPRLLPPLLPLPDVRPNAEGYVPLGGGRVQY